MKRLILTLLIIILSSPLYSQKEYNEWVIGYNLGLSFNNPNKEVEVRNDFTLQEFEYDTIPTWLMMHPSNISDKMGNLKYYSLGKYLRSNQSSLNNENLLGGYIEDYEDQGVGRERCYHYNWSGAKQNSILLNIDSTYIRIANNLIRQGNSNLSYSILKNDNFIVKDKIFKSNYISGGLHAIKNFKTNDYWLITYNESSENYTSRLVTQDGVVKEPNSQLISKLRKVSFGFNCSMIKSSPNGQYIIAVFNMLGNNFNTSNSHESYFELLEFNPLTGHFIKKISTTLGVNAVSAEFSEDSRFLFLSDLWIKGQTFYLLKVDLFEKMVNKIILPSYGVINTSAHAMQLAPNGKIYASWKDLLSDLDCEGAIYISEFEISPTAEKNVIFKNVIAKSGNEQKFWEFPNIPTTQYLRVYTKSKLEVCEGEEVQLESFVVYPQADTIYSWSGPNGFASNEQNPILKNLTKADEGIYIVTVNGREEPYTAETYVKVNESPKPIILKRPDKKLCVGSELILSTEKEYEHYLWSTGDTTPVTRVYKSGTYSVSVIDTLGCEGMTSIDIVFYGDSELAIEGDTIKCIGESVTLSSTDEYPEYKWSNGEKTRSITITTPARYTLTTKTEEGCTVSRTIEVKDHPKVNADLKPTPTTICNGDSTLLESKYDVPYYSYEWNTGATTKSIYVNSTGTYKLTITDIRTGCKDSTEIAIKVEDNLQPTIKGSNICSGESATLEVLPNDPSYTYLWSNGEETPVIVVTQAGTYTVIVSKAGCVGTAEFTVKESPTPRFDIQGESIICTNETATLTSDKDFSEYLWSTNEITKEIEVTEAGTYTLTVTDENGCTATKSIVVDKYELKFDISKDSIDFGKVYITETKTDNTTITNNSGFDITLDNGQIISDGQVYPFNYDFVPTQLGPFSNSIDISIIEPCDTVITIPITARVYARTTISTKDIYTQIGQTETVPVYLECEADLPTQDYSITTDIDRTVFFTNDSYVINQTQPINKNRTNIHNLTGTILLSNSLEYDITFPSYTFTNPYIEVIEQPGKIYIDSVCVFPLRNITTFDPTTLDISPNPASEQLNINITTGVQGTMKLELVAIDGRVIYSDEWTQSTRTKQMQINTLAIPSGLYQVRLITPYDAVTKSVVVVE